VRYAVDPTRTSTFEVTTPSPDRDYAVLGAGVAASFPAGWSAFVDYNTLVGLANFDVHTVNFGVRKSF
jgi:outer membrane autotransporter protein